MAEGAVAEGLKSAFSAFGNAGRKVAGVVGESLSRAWRGLHSTSPAIRDAITSPGRPIGGEIVGGSSGRPFNPDKAGGPIRDLEYEKAKITDKGIDVVEKHTDRFRDPDIPELTADNDYMIDRLRKIASGELAPEPVDLRYYTHELRESVRYRNLGWETGQPMDADAAYDLWNNAHTATLEDYGLREGKGVIYHPDAPNQ